MTWNTCFKCKCQMWIPDALNEAALLEMLAAWQKKRNAIVPQVAAEFIMAAM